METDVTNDCTCCGKVISNAYINTYIPLFDKRYYLHENVKKGDWSRQDIIFLCTNCMLYRKSKELNKWYEVKVPKHIPEAQIDRFAKRLLFGRNYRCTKTHLQAQGRKRQKMK